MSDRLFVGLAPKSDAGREYMIFNLDDHARSRRKCSGRQKADIYYGD